MVLQWVKGTRGEGKEEGVQNVEVEVLGVECKFEGDRFADTSV